MKKIAMIMISLLTIAILAGCNKGEQYSQTYNAVGDIESIEKTSGVVEGVKSEYVVKVVNIQPGSTPNPKDVSTMSISITKNTAVYLSSNDKKMKADISAIEKGKSAEIVWHFANDHLTEAIEINMQ